MDPDLLAKAPLLIKEYLGYQSTIKGRSPKTVKEYYYDLRTFFRYMKLSEGLVPPATDFNQIDISDIDEELIASVTLTRVFEYMNFLITEKSNSTAARQRKTSSLRMFYKYLVNQKHLLERNPLEQLETPKRKKALPKHLTLSQSLELLNAVEGDFRERDYCMITLFLNCGMRLSELVGMNMTDIRGNATMIRIVGKGNKERIVYLNEACRDAIAAYLAVRPKNDLKDRKALFLSRQKRRISPRMVELIVNKYLNAIGLGGPGFSVHKLRHTAATLMYQHGNVDIRVLKDILGHENLGTTEIYTHLSSSQMKDAVSANPLAKVSPPKPTPSPKKKKTEEA